MTYGMPDADAVHFSTALGPLCGVSGGCRRSQDEASTTCPVCREMLDAGLRQRISADLAALRRLVALCRVRGTG